MSATITRLVTDHRRRTQEWLKNPDRRPYRVSVVGAIRIARCGELVLGSFHTHAEAFAKIDEHIATPWKRAS